MRNELVVAAGAIPVTMFLLANIGGNTAQMTQDGTAIRQSLGMAAAAMIIASAATGNLGATIATGLAIGASFWAMRDVWQIPGLKEVVPS